MKTDKEFDINTTLDVLDKIEKVTINPSVKEKIRCFILHIILIAIRLNKSL